MQGRYKAILFDDDSYLLELARYGVLNPVRVGMVGDPGTWLWSSYRAMIGGQAAPQGLATDGMGTAEPIWNELNGQAFLGEYAVVRRSPRHAKHAGDENIPKAKRRPRRRALPRVPEKHGDRDEAIVAEHASGGYSDQQIADYFGVQFTTVWRVVRAAKSREQ